MPVANITSSLRLGILSDFAEMYKNRYPIYASRQDKFIKRPTKKIQTRTAEFALKESIPMPEFWPYNHPRRRKTIKDRYITVYHYPFELSLPWNMWDEEDDILQDLKPHLESSTNRFLQIPDIMVADYLNNAATMQPVISNAFDGAALVATTAGGAARFGVTGGNIVTSTGTGTVAAILHDLFVVQQRFLQMQDTQGQPFFSPEEVDISKFTVVAPTQLNEVMRNAQEQKNAHVDLAINTAADNILHKKFDLWVNQRLSTSSNDWYVFLDHPYLKPFFYLLRDDIQSIVEDETNSDKSRDLGQRALLACLRSGMTPFAPMSCIQVNS